MMELTTYTELEIAHRLMTAYAQKCTSCHGHRYEVEITVTAQKFNEDGMIVDFKKLKEVVKTVLDDKWDHGSCFNVTDPLAKAVAASGSERVHIIAANPTLEWMVQHWALELQLALDVECPGVVISTLKASETARNTVTWRRDCLPWEKSQPANDPKKPEYVDDSKKPMCAEKERDSLDAAYRRRLERAALRPCPITDSLEVEVDESTPMDEQEEVDVPIDDTALYLVQFRTKKLPYSTTVRTALEGDALVDRCYEAARAFVGGTMKLVPENTPVEDVVLLGITKLPG